MDKKQLNDYMMQMFIQAKAQFGKAVLGTWVYDFEKCPGCKRTASMMKHKGHETLSLNGFMYRQRGILIGYLLCNRCGNNIHRNAKRTPGIPSKLHYKIEDTLEKAYEAHLHVGKLPN